MTGRDIVTAALKLIGAFAPGESLPAAEATDGLGTLNRMLSSFSNDNLLIHARVREEFTLVSGTQQYTMGSGATFDTDRPLEISQALIRDESVSEAVEYPIRIVSLEEWSRIFAKGVSAPYPTALYAHGTYPNETIDLFPKPSAAHKLVLWSVKPLSSISTLDTAVSLPPGYEELLIYNLAPRLAPEYGRQTPAEVMKIAMDSMASIKRRNNRPHYLRIDDAITGDGRGFDIYSGGAIR